MWTKMPKKKRKEARGIVKNQQVADWKKHLDDFYSMLPENVESVQTGHVLYLYYQSDNSIAQASKLAEAQFDTVFPKHKIRGLVDRMSKLLRDISAFSQVSLIF